MHYEDINIYNSNSFMAEFFIQNLYCLLVQLLKYPVNKFGSHTMIASKSNYESFCWK